MLNGSRRARRVYNCHVDEVLLTNAAEAFGKIRAKPPEVDPKRRLSHFLMGDLRSRLNMAGHSRPFSKG